MFEKHTTSIQGVITNDLSVINIFSFFFIYRIFPQTEGILLNVGSSGENNAVCENVDAILYICPEGSRK